MVAKLTKKLDAMFSLWVRQVYASDGVGVCCTCGFTAPWRQLQCGHYMSRRFKSTRWDRRNAGPQCARCNAWGNPNLQGVPGEGEAMALWIDRTHGEGTSAMLRTLAKRHPWKPRAHELEVLVQEFRQDLESRGFVTR